MKIYFVDFFTKRQSFISGLHPSQFPLYPNQAAISQLERERLGIPPSHHGLDPNDPMVSSTLADHTSWCALNSNWIDQHRPNTKQKTNPNRIPCKFTTKKFCEFLLQSFIHNVIWGNFFIFKLKQTKNLFFFTFCVFLFMVDSTILFFFDWNLADTIGWRISRPFSYSFTFAFTATARSRRISATTWVCIRIET